MQMTKYIEMIKDISCDGNFAIKFQSKWNEMKWNGLLCDAQIDASNKNELGFKLERTLKASTQGPEKLVSACKHVIFLHRGTGGNWRWFQPLVLPLIYPQPPLRWPTMDNCWSRGHFLNLRLPSHLRSPDFVRCEKLSLGSCSCPVFGDRPVQPKDPLQRDQPSCPHPVTSGKGFHV